MRARAMRSPPLPEPQSRLRIGALADATGVAVDTIRYYERMGLIEPPPRHGGEHRHYPPETIEELRLIRKTRQLGFSLTAVHALMVLLKTPCTTAPQAEALLTEIESRLQHLAMLKLAVLRSVHDNESADGPR